MKLSLIVAGMLVAAPVAAQQPRLAGDTSAARVLVETWEKQTNTTLACLYGVVQGDTITIERAKATEIKDTCEGAIGIAGFIANENVFDRQEVLDAMTVVLRSYPRFNVVATVYGAEPVNTPDGIFRAPRMWAALRPSNER